MEKTIEEGEKNCNKEFGRLDSPEYLETRSCNGAMEIKRSTMATFSAH